MVLSHRSIATIVGGASLVAICFILLPPIAQSPQYHVFADRRTILGVPNFWNVISNLPFFVAALFGIRALRSPTAFTEPWERIAFCALLAGTVAVSVGSTYYHLHPDDRRLFWDRLPMTVVFMSLLATTIGERVSMSVGKHALMPLILLGIGSVLAWRHSGDLRLYAVVQFGTLLAVPLMLALLPARYSGASSVWCAVVVYSLAKVAELLDHRIAAVIATGGHPWKHAAAAVAIFVYATGVARRRPLDIATASPAPLPVAILSQEAAR